MKNNDEDRPPSYISYGNGDDDEVYQKVKEVWVNHDKSPITAAHEFSQLYSSSAHELECTKIQVNMLRTVNEKLHDEIHHWRQRALAAEKQRKPL